MISDDAWAFTLPVYMFMIRYGIPVLGVLILVVLAYLWFRYVYNSIFDILHPDADIKTQRTNTWYIPKEEREKMFVTVVTAAESETEEAKIENNSM